MKNLLRSAITAVVVAVGVLVASYGTASAEGAVPDGTFDSLDLVQPLSPPAGETSTSVPLGWRRVTLEWDAATTVTAQDALLVINHLSRTGR